MLPYANNCWHFNIYEHDYDKYHAQLSLAWKFYNLQQELHTCHSPGAIGKFIEVYIWNKK